MPPSLLIAFGAVLRDARRASGLSQIELAGVAGVHFNTVGLVERGEMSVSLETMDRLCEAVGFRPWQLLLEADSLLGR